MGQISTIGTLSTPTHIHVGFNANKALYLRSSKCRVNGWAAKRPQACEAKPSTKAAKPPALRGKERRRRKRTRGSEGAKRASGRAEPSESATAGSASRAAVAQTRRKQTAARRADRDRANVESEEEATRFERSRTGGREAEAARPPQREHA